MEEARELEIYRERVVEPAGRQGLLELRCLELVKTIKDVSELPNWRNILVQVWDSIACPWHATPHGMFLNVARHIAVFGLLVSPVNL